MIRAQRPSDDVLAAIDEAIVPQFEAMAETMAAIGRLVAEQVAPAYRRLVEQMHAALPAVQQVAEAVCAVDDCDKPAVGRPRRPAYRDDRPRHESPYGPRQRRR